MFPLLAPLACNNAGAAVNACRAGLEFGQFLSYRVEDAVASKDLRVVLAKFEHPPVPGFCGLDEGRILSEFAAFRAIRMGSLRGTYAAY